MANDYTSDIKKTSDKGLTWQDKLIHDKPYLCGSITTAEGVYYVQTQSEGLLRSTDNGETWNQCGGPNGNLDTRLIFALNKNHVFAIDQQGNLWETTNSGGDSLAGSGSSPQPKTTFHFTSAKIINDSIGAIVKLPIYLHHSGAMSTVDMVLHYPDGPLKYLGSFLAGGNSIDVPFSRWSGRAGLSINGTDLNALTDSLVGYSVFTWSPLEYDCAFIHYDSITSIVADSCVAVVAHDSCVGIIGAYQWCGTSAVAAVNSGQAVPFVLVPNPSVSNVVLQSASYSGMTEVRVYDSEGKLLYNSKGYISPENPLELVTASLSGGSYRILILREGFIPYDLQFIRQ